jgi:lipopolysaccharide/colanic/teichoic acid biosynthesis glycosyltransferase
MFRTQYAVILQERPGITDPATLAYRHEEQILTASQREEQYVQQVLPFKLKLSLAYQQRRSLLSDIQILLETAVGLIT